MIRAQTRFGNFMLGGTPRVVGCISAPATLAQVPTPDCHIVELRLDLLGRIALPALAQPTIATVRLASEGGQWTQPDPDRLPLFDAALQCCTAADIEFRSPLLEKVSVLAVKYQKALIISYHDFEKTPPLDELRSVMAKAANYGTVVKIATLAKTEDDLATLRALFRENCSAALCVLGMGPLSKQTRLEFPKLGSCLTYGYLDRPIAPGQPAARELMASFG
ncbi:MAG: 3-dehydroquinate dehydratase [Verrucomicrobiae bacterium]|nr:3-dehydroquinate dehydratase [Verrucomicrobiae bacterium]